MWQRKPKKRWGLRIFLTLVLVVAAVRVSLPYVLEWQIKERIAASGQYRGTLGDIDLNLWRGAYEIEGMRLDKVGSKVQEPFFTVAKLDLSVDWSSLFHGALVGEATLHQPVLNYVKGTDEASSQTEPPKHWKKQMQELFPVRFDRIEVRDGTVTYRNSQEGDASVVKLSQLEGVARNLTNAETLSAELPATLDVRALAMDTGSLTLHANIDPFAKQPTFELDAKFTDIALEKIGSLFRTTANLDIEGGVFDASVDIRAADGRFRGTVRPFFENVKVVRWREEGGKGSGVLNQLLSQLEDQANEILLGGEQSYSAKIPVSGKFVPGEGVVDTMASTLRAALLRGLMTGLERAAEERFGS